MRDGVLFVPRKLGWIARFVNALMVPLMYLLSGTFRERPQHTHPWTCQRLSWEQEAHIQEINATKYDAVKAIARHYWWDFRFHIPAWKGWRKYVVLDSMFGGKWYVGWRPQVCSNEESAEVSRIPQVGPVRVLLGPRDIMFFGIDAMGVQVPIHKIGDGEIGDGGPFCKTPLS